MSARLRLVFFGTPEAALPSFEALSRRHEIVLAVTQPERGRARGRRRPVAEAAARFGVPTVMPERARDAIPAIEVAAAPLAAVVAYGQILPQPILRLFSIGMVNLHFSLLPRWRGAAPVERAILAGDRVTGVTTMLIDEGMDQGPILLQRKVAIGEGERAGELTERLAVIGAPLLSDSIEGLASGSLSPAPQDGSMATLAPKLQPEERAIAWDQSADEVVRRVRAFSPRPGAFTSFRGRRLKVVSARVGDPHKGAPAGALVDRPLRAAALDCWVQLGSVQVEGRRPVSGEEFARGARITPGESLT